MQCKRCGCYDGHNRSCPNRFDWTKREDAEHLLLELVSELWVGKGQWNNGPVDAILERVIASGYTPLPAGGVDNLGKVHAGI